MIDNLMTAIKTDRDFTGVQLKSQGVNVDPYVSRTQPAPAAAEPAAAAPDLSSAPQDDIDRDHQAGAGKMTYEEAVAEKKRREQAGTWKATPPPAADTAAPAPADTTEYDAAVGEATKRAAQTRTDAGDSWGGTWSDINDAMRLTASGLTLGGSDYIAAAGNTALGNIGSGIKIFGKPLMEDPTFGDEVRKQNVEDMMARSRIDARTGYEGSGRGIEGVAGAVGLGKLGVLKPMAKAGLYGGGAYLASKLGNDPLTMYGGYCRNPRHSR